MPKTVARDGARLRCCPHPLRYMMCSEVCTGSRGRSTHSGASDFSRRGGHFSKGRGFEKSSTEKTRSRSAGAIFKSPHVETFSGRVCGSAFNVNPASRCAERKLEQPCRRIVGGRHQLGWRSARHHAHFRPRVVHRIHSYIFQGRECRRCQRAE